MPIRVYCYASFGNNTGLWAYNIEYFPEDGNKGHDIWNSGNGFVENTTLLQMQLNSVLEALWYLNSLTYALEPDTKDLVIHVPSKRIIQILKNPDSVNDDSVDRSKTRRLYRSYVDDIMTEASGWNIEYKMISAELPEWLLARLEWK